MAFAFEETKFLDTIPSVLNPSDLHKILVGDDPGSREGAGLRKLVSM